jgi:hypothetical protein
VKLSRWIFLSADSMAFAKRYVMYAMKNNKEVVLQLYIAD